MSARLPLGSGTSNIPLMSCRTNRRKVPRATAIAVPSVKGEQPSGEEDANAVIAVY